MNNNTSMAIEAHNVEKHLGGVAILRGVNLWVEYGEIVAIVGANGSGKSLFLRTLCGLVYPDKGQIVIGGQLLKPGMTGALADVGVLIETPGFLPYLSGMDNLRLLAMLRRRITDDEVAMAMRQVGLDPANKRPVRTYSMGMRQRLGIAQALMERPRVLLLDEPTNALDPEFTETFLQMLKTLRTQGVAIVLTSHELHEVAELADRILVMRDGILSDYRPA